MHKPITLPFSVLNHEDVIEAGEYGVLLGELVKEAFPVSEGFVIPAYVYFQFLHSGNLIGRIADLLTTINYERQDSVQQVAYHLHRMILGHELQPHLLKEINAAYTNLGGFLKNAELTLHTSPAVGTLLNSPYPLAIPPIIGVKGEANLFIGIKRLWTELFSDRALLYQHEHGLDHFRIGMAVVVQKMINPDVSGILYTMHPQTHEKDKMVIEAVLGEMEAISQDKVTPDRYEIAKTTGAILERTVSNQNMMMRYIHTRLTDIPVTEKRTALPKLTTEQINKLGELGKKLENHYYFPQVMHWAIEKNRFYVTSVKKMNTIPSTKHSNQVLTTDDMQLLLNGIPVSHSVTSGIVRIVDHPETTHTLARGDILVTSHITPEFKYALRRVSGFICEKGNALSYAAVLARELGIPALVGATDARKILRNGMIVTINGEDGNVYKGSIFRSHHLTVKSNILNGSTATKVFAAINKQHTIDFLHRTTVDGVVFSAADALIKQHGVHPEYMLLHGKKKVVIRELVSELEMLCKAICPSPILYSFSDLTTEDYSNLKHGAGRELTESNPFLGFHGASRMLAAPEMFRIETEALQVAGENQELKDLRLLLPFVRTPHELIEVKHALSQVGIERTSGLGFWLAVDTPLTAILLEQFVATGIDGVVINLDNLTTLLMGIDKHNHAVAKLFDEQNPGVLWVIEHIIKTCKKLQIPSAISLHTSHFISTLFVNKLVDWGISIIALPANQIENVRKIVAEAEARKILKQEKFLAN